jgi:biofilm PGA synthesis lipoprotein PgaB
MMLLLRKHRFALPALLLAAAAMLAAAVTARRAEAAAPATAALLALCYHNVEDREPDQTYLGVTTAKLIEQFAWLQANGYRPVSIDQILAARDGRAALPDKPVLLTFDDGYESFYTRVFPILKAFEYPAVLALVGSWMESKPGTDVRYGDATAPRDAFMSWDQVREVAASGLVEIAAHSEELHAGTPANPQGNTQPAAATRRYDAATGRYESDAAYERRLAADVTAVSALIERRTGRRPRVMVWPYGEHNGTALSIARERGGMPVTLTLADAPASVADLAALPRHLVSADPDLDRFVQEIHRLGEGRPQRVMQVDLDYVYDPDPAQQERNLDALVQRVVDLGAGTIYLQAFADPDGSGLAREVYFPNRHLPVRADLFNRAAWQLRTRARVEVYAWMPVLAYHLGDRAAAAAPVLAWAAPPGGGAARAEPDRRMYPRLSPFDPEARRIILDIYEDLARHASFQGLLFHDDAVLSDFEDASAPALAAYVAAGLPVSIGAIRDDPALRARWSRLKTDALIGFTQEIAERVRRFRSPLKTARNIYARPVLEPQSEEWFAQDFDRFLAAYDFTAVMAMPLMENVPGGRRAEAWLRRLVAAVAARPDGLKRTVFELQAVDWRRQQEQGGGARPVDAADLAGQMRLLSRLGALNFGYYPDDFIAGRPDLRTVHREFSLQQHPYRP